MGLSIEQLQQAQRLTEEDEWRHATLKEKVFYCGLALSLADELVGTKRFGLAAVARLFRIESTALRSRIEITASLRYMGSRDTWERRLQEDAGLTIPGPRLYQGHVLNRRRA